MGLVGCGVGLAHARAYVSLPDKFELAAICDIDESRASEAAEEFGTAHTYADFDALCSRDDLDVIDICTPSCLHFQHARQALAAGKHVLVEYPICQSLEELDELFALAKFKSLVLHDGLTVRAERLHRGMKQLAPRVGRIFHVHYRYFGCGGWYLDPALRGNAFLALHIHFINQFEDLVGATRRINATWTVHRQGEANIHTGTVMQEFDGGASGIQEFGMGYPCGPSYLGWCAGENGWMQFTGAKAIRLVLKDGTDEEIKTEPCDAVAHDTANFVARIFDGAEPWVSEAQTRRTMRLCLAAAESAETGRKIDVT